MASATSLSYLFGPLVAVAMVGLFALILRWAFSRGSSLVAAAPKQGTTEEYGLLVPIATPATFIEGELLRRRLEDGGVRANLVSTLDGPRLMVWPQDETRARSALADDR